MAISLSDRCQPRTIGSGDNAGVLAPPPLIFAIGLGTGEALDLVLPVSIPSGRAVAVIAWVAAALGGSLAAWFVVSFRRAGTAVDPGRPTSTLVTTGPYRFTRNPGYLGMTLAYLAVAVATSSVGALMMLLPTLAVIDCAVVRREERYLESKFGPSYTAYRQRVRRWI